MTDSVTYDFRDFKEGGGEGMHTATVAFPIFGRSALSYV